MANLVCYFSNIMAVIKVPLLNTYCNSLYDNELWDLGHSSVSDACVSWRKGVRGIWGLPADAHCELLPITCESIPLIDALSSRSVNIINCCLKSNNLDNLTDCALAGHGIYYSYMHSPTGTWAFNCSMCYGVYTGDISVIKSSLVKCHDRMFRYGCTFFV